MNAQSTVPTRSDALRVETLATRLTAAEMQGVAAAAESSGISRSEWLRASALAYLQRPHQTHDDSIESTILEELMGLRLVILNLFAAATPGLALQTVHLIMAHAESSKHIEATKVVSGAGKSQACN